jgi:hypothetical protein
MLSIAHRYSAMTARKGTICSVSCTNKRRCILIVKVVLRAKEEHTITSHAKEKHKERDMSARYLRNPTFHIAE